MKATMPVWRSLMYCPVNVEKYVDKAHTRGADVIQLDLEDSVPPTEKACLLYTSPSPRDGLLSRMPSSA